MIIGSCGRGHMSHALLARRRKKHAKPGREWTKAVGFPCLRRVNRNRIFSRLACSSRHPDVRTEAMAPELSGRPVDATETPWCLDINIIWERHGNAMGAP